MSTHKHIDIICCVVLAVTLLITVIFVNGERFGINIITSAMGYENRLFDNTRVHTLDIVIDDWDSFLENCEQEEYALCSVVIDNESFKNVAIRAKGNTSLSQVKQYGNNRYSFKLEFDHYDSSFNYHGLDKLCLNNIIQDNTYVKDYLAYTMMYEFGVSSPLCSFTYITVNGADWGLYLAVEGVEDSFLERNFDSSGNLYKPDSMTMGGGRGNGKGFEPDENMNPDSEENMNPEMKSKPENDGRNMQDNSPPQKPDGKNEAPPDGDFGGRDMAPPDGETPKMPEANSGEPPEMPENNGGGGQDEKRDGGMSARGSDAVKLIYSDDNPDSYSDIFDSAKTDITDSDKSRLINSLKNLNENTDIENTVDIDSVIRYFVVHNFMLNFDSYTGGMIHNYYLYENNGKLQMIPWDYNLSFGAFGGGNSAQSLVNYPIDSPVSDGTTDSRPMLAWIFKNEKYTELYHKYFSEFIEKYYTSGRLSEMVASLKDMLSPYVEKDPTKFCTFDEFTKGIDTLDRFCSLRCQSIAGQLDGTVPSDSDGQSADSSKLVKVNDINISDMGSQGMGKGESFDKNTQPDGNAPPDFPNGKPE